MSPIGACSGRLWPSCSAPVAARGPGRSPPTTRTPPPWAWRRPVWPSGPCPTAAVDALWFATATPAYLDKTNATTIHAALRQPRHVPAFDFGGALRSGAGALRAGLAAGGTGTTLVVLSDLRDGLPTSADEISGGDGAAAVLIGDDGPGSPVIAEYLGGASVSDEFLDRWRTPGDRRSKVWEERFGETRYVPLGVEAWESALKAAGHDRRPGRPGGRDRHARPGRQGPGPPGSGCGDGVLADDLTTTVGQTGAAHPGWSWPR